MAKGGKTGGGKGGKGGGGGKGKKGGGCSPGDIVKVGLSSKLFQTVKAAFDSATGSPGGTRTVSLECTVAQDLVIQVASGMATNFSPKNPKGKKGGK
jgi:hypothetical protein